MVIRFARENELEQVNELRRQVSELHAEGEPTIFRAGFPDELRRYVYDVWNDPEQWIVVAESEGTICGLAVLHHIFRPENPYMYERDYMDIDEFCVDRNYRRQGIASEMIAFIRDFTGKLGLKRLELNMWDFNRDALAFYEAVGFHTYRRYLEMDVE